MQEFQNFLMVHIWGIHMALRVGDDPAEAGRGYVGWPRVRDVLKVPASQDAYKEVVASAYPEKKAGAIRLDAGTLYRFALEIHAGGSVVCRSKHNRMENVGRTTMP